MDPITLFATVSTVWAGVKKAVEFGREAQDILGQLSQWAQAVDDFDHAVQQENKKPKLIKKLKSATAEAFDEYAAKVRIREQEAELRHLFLYGELNHLGLDGYREFIQLRRQIREKRIREIQDAKFRKEQLVENLITGGLIVLIVGAAGLFLWAMILLVIGG